ncbi:MAG: LysR family transcriptional regulator [Bacteroidales bacterium]|nr:LysR family transcriptional regulator [Bacteroidales bacterium]
MEKTLFMRAAEVAEVLGVSETYAYKLIKKLTEELKAKGYLVIDGRINREYFMEKVYSKEYGKEVN